MAINSWRGDAPAIAQEVTISPPDYTAKIDFVIGGRALGYSSAYNVEEMVTAWNDSAINEFKEILAIDSSTLTGATGSARLILKSRTAGKPFAVVVTLNGQTGTTNEVQSIRIGNSPTGGTFTLTFDGQTTAGIAYNADQYAIQTALEALSNISSGDVLVLGSATSFTVQYTGNLAEANQPLILINIANLTGGNNTISVETITPGVDGVNEVQKISLGASTSGTFTLSYDGVETGNIAYNASAATVQTALEAVLGSGNVSCSGGALPGTDVSATFIGDLAGVAVNTLVGDGSSLSGGGGPAVSSITTGVAGTNAVYKFRLDDEPTAGDQVDLYIGDSGEIEHTGLFDYDATAATIQALFDALAMGAGHFTVTGSLDGSWLDEGDGSFNELSIEFTGRLNSWNGSGTGLFIGKNRYTAAATSHTQSAPYQYSSNGITLSVGAVGATGTNAVVEIATSSVPFRVNFDGGTFSDIINPTDTPTQINFALINCFGVYPGTLPRRYLGPNRSIHYTTYGVPCAVASTGGASDDISTSAVRLTFDSAGYQSAVAPTVATSSTASDVDIEITTPAVEAVAEIKEISIVGDTPWGGDFTLTDDSDNTTSAIGFDGTADDVESELETIFGSTLVNATGGPFPLEPVRVVFDSSLGNVEEITGDGSGLDNSTGSTSTTLHGGQSLYPSTNQRSRGPEHFDDPLNWTLGVVPTRTDELRFEEGSIGPKYGLLQLAVFNMPAIGSNFTNFEAVHDFTVGQVVRLTTTGTLPTGLSLNTDYTIARSSKDRGTFSLRDSTGALVVVASDDGSGTHTVALEVANILQYATFNGSIGLRRFDNQGNYKQYRATKLSIGFTSSTAKQIFGQGEGSGSGLIRLYTGAYQFNLESIVTGGSIEPDRPALHVSGSSDLNTIELYDGDLGVAVYADESASILTYNQRGGTCVMGENITFPSGAVIDKTDGDLTIMNAAAASTVMKLRG